MASNDPRATCVSIISKAFCRAAKTAKSSSLATVSTVRSSLLRLKSTTRQPCLPSVDPAVPVARVVVEMAQGLLAEVLAAVTMAAQSTRLGTGVTVTALCPGPTPTGFQERANVGRLRGLRLLMRVSPEAVVRAGYNGMKRGRPVVIPGLLNNLLVFMLRFAPRRLVTNVVRRLQTHPRSA